MHLIRLEMDQRSPLTRRLLSDCQQMHCFLMRLFGSDRASAQVLYRTHMSAGCLRIYVYAKEALQTTPEGCRVVQKDISIYLDGLRAGQSLSFDLVAAPTVKISETGVKNSRRRILREPEERKSWLNRKAEQNGFTILSLTEQEQIHVSGKHCADRGGAMYHDAYHYQGTLIIEDVTAFRKAMQEGIGSGKAYGFGMLMVKQR